jgi:hypothetical protein
MCVQRLTIFALWGGWRLAFLGLWLCSGPRLAHAEDSAPLGAGSDADAAAAAALIGPQYENPGPLGIPRSRLGSGTSWLPDASPMPGLIMASDTWRLLLRGNVFVGFDWFSSDRGGSQLVSINSFGGLIWRTIGPGEFMARLTLSLEPLTVGESGYPLIVQTGETGDGQPLHDRQHPHDLFSELALSYRLPLIERLGLGLELYLAPAGEPALGPPAFRQRPSALSDPLAPIAHNWQDGTHISFGVITAGVFTREWKLEASWFNGRDPDDNRWELDLDVPDSFAIRISYSPTPAISAQASYGHLANPQHLDPSVSVDLFTISGTYNHRIDATANWATTVVLSQKSDSAGHQTKSMLAESTWDLPGPHVVFGRIEYVRKTGGDLVLPSTYANRAYDLGMLGLGYVYEFGPFGWLIPGVGARATLGTVESDLTDTFYGTAFPVGLMFFAQLHPTETSLR